MSDPDPLEVVRRVVASLSDEAIIAIVHSLVSGIVRGFLNEAVRNVDGLVDQVVTGVTDQIADATEPAPAPGPDLRLISKPPREQDLIKRTCEICGRVGSRRFTLTDTGWRCSPTATACPGNRTFPPPPAAAAPKTVEPKPKPKPDPEPAREPGHAATARCTDCTRTWVLTGDVLDLAIEKHEQKSSHIVEKVAVDA